MDINSSQFDPGSGIFVNRAFGDKPKSQAVPRVEDQRQSGQQPEAAIVLRKGDADAFDRADKFRAQQQRTYREFYDSRSHSAIQAYTSLAIENKRAEIHGLLGVDTYV